MCCLQVSEANYDELVKELFGSSVGDSDDGDTTDSTAGSSPSAYQQVGNSRFLLPLACCYSLGRSAAMQGEGK